MRVIRFSRGAYRILLVDMGILLLESGVCLEVSLTGARLAWYLPASMLLLTAVLILLVMQQAFN